MEKAERFDVIQKMTSDFPQEDLKIMLILLESKILIKKPQSCTAIIGMRIIQTDDFKRAFKKLPQAIQRLSDSRGFLLTDWRSPRLHIKRIKP